MSYVLYVVKATSDLLYTKYRIYTHSMLTLSTIMNIIIWPSCCKKYINVPYKQYLNDNFSYFTLSSKCFGSVHFLMILISLSHSFIYLFITVKTVIFEKYYI